MQYHNISDYYNNIIIQNRYIILPGSLVVASVVGASVVGASVVGASVVGASVMGASVVGGAIVVNSRATVVMY